MRGGLRGHRVREVFVATGTRGTGKNQLLQTPIQPSLADHQVVLSIERLQRSGKVCEYLPKGLEVTVPICMGGQLCRGVYRHRVGR